MTPLPWHDSAWQRLMQLRASDRIPHGMLITGPQGVGKRQLAEAFASALLCASPSETGTACGQCKSCLLLRAGSHPDISRLSPAEDSREILVDDIRAMTEHATLSAQMSGYKLILIEPAHMMSIGGSNSLLKTLEEPVSRTILLLLTASPAALPATIRSRCQQLRITPPTTETGLQWLQQQGVKQHSELLLQLARGAPLLALRLNQPEILKLRAHAVDQFCAMLEGRADPVEVAGQWYKLDLELLLNWMSGWVIDMLAATVGESSAASNPDLLERLRDLATRLSRQRLYGLLDQLYEARRLLPRGVLNTQLLTEDLLLMLVQCRNKPAR